jgi:hypothetical protein
MSLNIFCIIVLSSKQHYLFGVDSELESYVRVKRKPLLNLLQCILTLLNFSGVVLNVSQSDWFRKRPLYLPREW